MRRLLLSLVFALLLVGVAYGQDEKFEVTGDYSYFRLNPGLPSYFNSQNLNGGGGSFAAYVTPNIGIVGDLQGYGSFTQCTKPTAPTTGCASGNLFTYLFGPQFKFRTHRFEPFAEVLVGGAHTNFYANACTHTTIGLVCGGRAPSNNAFDILVGGGLDIRASEHFTVRLLDADYELTRFGNNFTGGNNSQSNFRFTTGIQFRF